MHPTTPPSAHTAKQVASLRKQALSYPEAHEDFPWGHSAFKVKGKAFAFLHADAEGFSISVKLPDSNALALHLPFAEPTGYGLGKSGWVTARFTKGQVAPQMVLSAWLEESFTAIAPKRMVAAFLSRPEAAASKRAAPRASKTTKKPAAKKSVLKRTVAQKSSAVEARGSARTQKKASARGRVSSKG
jgi:predicted DNA-binding protein (MmcQ/YjbR family)